MTKDQNLDFRIEHPVTAGDRLQPQDLGRIEVAEIRSTPAVNVIADLVKHGKEYEYVAIPARFAAYRDRYYGMP